MVDSLPQDARFSVPLELAGQRLDRVLSQLISGASRSRLQELIRDGGILVDESEAKKPALALEAGQTIVVRSVQRSRERTGSAEGLELDVVYEDEQLVVVDKPAGMVAHPSGVVRGGTVSERAVERWGPLPAPQGEDRPGIVHRLDADTSGLLLIAKTEAAGESLVQQFQDREVRKTYQAIVFGEPRFDSDWIEAPIGRSTKRSDRMSVVDSGREAATFYETVERLDGFGVVRCRPRTGRTHQIRVHLAHIDHPIVGDRIYRGRRGLALNVRKGGPGMKRHALHASALEFKHPTTRKTVSFEVGLPADMSAFLEWLRQR